MTSTNEALEIAASLQRYWQHPDMHDATELIRSLVVDRDESLATLNSVKHILDHPTEFRSSYDLISALSLIVDLPDQYAQSIEIDLRTQAESEVETLRKVIEDAPHDGVCGFSMMHGCKCTCWKSKSLPEKETS